MRSRVQSPVWSRVELWVALSGYNTNIELLKRENPLGKFIDVVIDFIRLKGSREVTLLLNGWTLLNKLWTLFFLWWKSVWCVFAVRLLKTDIMFLVSVRMGFGNRKFGQFASTRYIATVATQNASNLKILFSLAAVYRELIFARRASWLEKWPYFFNI